MICFKDKYKPHIQALRRWRSREHCGPASRIPSALLPSPLMMETPLMAIPLAAIPSGFTSPLEAGF
jgi:hypothetical protein